MNGHCELCGREFTRKRKTDRYCSALCKAFAGLNIPRDSDSCWIWEGALSTSGRGTMYFQGSTCILIPKLIYEATCSKLRRGDQITTSCGDARCCNPHHMQIKPKAKYYTPRWEKGQPKACKTCGTKFKMASGPGWYCGPICSFLGKVQVPDSARPGYEELGPCWEWTGWKDKDGYAGFAFKPSPDKPYESIRASRYCYTQEYGPITRGQLVLHKCDNPGCVNPDHLYLGTPQANNLDMVRRGRHPKAKLTEENVLEIRARLEKGEKLLKLAKEFGVSKSAIAGIYYGKSWTHLGPKIAETDPDFPKFAAILSDTQIKFIKDNLRDETLSVTELAKLFEVSDSTISGIKHGKTWKEKGAGDG